MTEIRQRNVYSKTEADHHTAYENQLEAVLADLREQQYVDLESMKADLEEHYVKKVTYCFVSCSQDSGIRWIHFEVLQPFCLRLIAVTSSRQ